MQTDFSWIKSSSKTFVQHNLWNKLKRRLLQQICTRTYSRCIFPILTLPFYFKEGLPLCWSAFASSEAYNTVIIWSVCGLSGAHQSPMVPWVQLPALPSTTAAALRRARSSLLIQMAVAWSPHVATSYLQEITKTHR